MTSPPVAASPLPPRGATLADRRSRIRGVRSRSRLPPAVRNSGQGLLATSRLQTLQGHGSAGFTLVEVLVALMILAIVAAMAWQGVDAILRSREIAAQRVERQLRVQSVLAQWEADLQEVQDVSSVVPALQFDGANLRLTRRAGAGMQLVVWSLRGDAWTRWAGPVVTRSGALQDTWMQSQQLLGNEAGALRALAGVSTWQLYFWRGNAWSNAHSSADSTTAGGTQRQSLPGGVRLVLAFAEGSNLAGTLTRDVRLAPQGGS